MTQIQDKTQYVQQHRRISNNTNQINYVQHLKLSLTRNMCNHTSNIVANIYQQHSNTNQERTKTASHSDECDVPFESVGLLDDEGYVLYESIGLGC